MIDITFVIDGQQYHVRAEIGDTLLDAAKKNNVPVVSDEDTANSLMHLDIGEEIPYSLYEAVSIILKHIYKLKAE